MKHGLKDDTAYNLNYGSTIAVSDHYPVYASFWSNRDTEYDKEYIEDFEEATEET